MNSKEFIQLCIDKGIEDVQITINSDYATSIKMINNEIDKKDILDVKTYMIKANYNDTTVSINAEYLDEDLINEIKEIALYTENKIKEDIIKPFDLESDNTFNKEIVDEFEEKLLEVDNFRKDNYKNNKSIIQEVCYEVSKKEIINTKGLDISSSNSRYSYLIDSASTKDDTTVTDASFIIKKNKHSLDILNIAKETLKNNELHLNSQKIKSGKYKILLYPSVSSRLIAYLTMLIDSNNTNKNLSYLNDKLNKKIFSDKLNIIEDPTDVLSPAYRTFDDEGTKTKKKDIVKNGVLKTFLYNNKNAKEVNTISTGNSYNVTIQCRNIYIKPGDKNIEELVSSMNDGIIILEIMLSSSSLNVTTGVYTGQIFSGFLVENGKIKHSIKDAIFTTDLNELFNNIIDIGNELEYNFFDIGAPALLIDNISITGDKDEN